MEVVSKGDHPPEITFRFWICVFHTFDGGGGGGRTRCDAGKSISGIHYVNESFRRFVTGGKLE